PKQVSNPRCYLATLLILLATLLVPGASAQVSAILSGTVADQSGAFISGVSVTAQNLDLGTSRTATTGAEGRYAIPSLSIGNYEIRATKQGFKEAVRTGVRLVVGQDATVDLQLVVGDVNQQVTVTGDAPI